MQKFVVGSLFSGIGGIELGLERTGGFETRWFVEREPYCQEVLRRHWPGKPIYDDIAAIDWGFVGPVDVLTGGFPCQDISNAGKREGITGERSGLWKEYLRAIRALQPGYVIVENVSALLDRGMGVVLGDLASCGYDCEWDCIPAQAVGAPHRRDRVFIVAYPHRSGYVHLRPVLNPATGGEQAQPWTVQGRDEMAIAYGGLDQSAQGEICPRRDAIDGASPGLADALPPGSETSIQRFSEKSMADAEGNGVENERIFGVGGKESQQATAAIKSFRESIGKEQWQAEPCLGRMVDGVSRGLDSYIWRERIKSLGNAVVPQVAQYIGQRILSNHSIGVRND